MNGPYMNGSHLNDSIENITVMLNQWIAGDKPVEDELINAVYPLLRDIAHKQLKKTSDPSINTTLIVHELYLKLKQRKQIKIQDKNHFLALSARLIRNIVVDIYRSNNAVKRGQLYQNVTLQEDETDEHHSTPDTLVDWMTLHNLLIELEKIDPDSVKLIELRFFAGLNIPETAEVLNTSSSTISRNWKFAKSWLFNRLKNDQKIDP